MCEKSCRPLRLIGAFLTFLVCAFVLGVDWYTFSQFMKYRIKDTDPGHTLTIALGALSGLGTALFALELWNTIRAYKIYTSDEDDVEDEEKSLQRWEDIQAFFQLVLQDAPLAVIMFVAYHNGSCELFVPIFEDSVTGFLAVIAAFAGGAWKIVTSLCSCLCGCCVGESRDCGWECCCCCCRALRTAIAVLLTAFGVFLIVTLSGKGVAVRTSC